MLLLIYDFAHEFVYCASRTVSCGNTVHCYQFLSVVSLQSFAFSALKLLVGQQEGHPACKKTEWWGAGVVVCLERGADLHMAQLMPLPLTVFCFSKIQIGFTFLVPAHLGSPGKGLLNMCVCFFVIRLYSNCNSCSFLRDC